MSLVASMTLGAIVLMALDGQVLRGGAFSLASYTRLNSVEKVASSVKVPVAYSWSRIEISYSGTDSGNSARLAAEQGLADELDVNFHFVICNGAGGDDGLIESTEKWLRQRPCLTGSDWYGSSQTIRICIITGGFRTLTDSQIKRTAALVETLSRKLDISVERISYPAGWQL